MDSLTHLVAGALTPLAFPETPKRAAVLGFGIAVGELPDFDVLFGISPEALLVLHRGITHALLWQPFLVLLAVLPFYIWMHCRKPPLRPLPAHEGLRRHPSDGTISFGVMYLMALFGVYTHIYLDGMTTFGTQIFLPFSAARVAAPAMFIVDLLLTVPALMLMIRAWRQPADIVPYRLASRTGEGPAPCGTPAASAKARRLALAGLAWILIYPLAALGVNSLATGLLGPSLAPDKGKLTLLTELFSPFVWKAVVDDGRQYRMSTVSLLAPRKPREVDGFMKPDTRLYEQLKDQLPLFGQFEEFCSFMVQTERPVPPLAQAGYRRPIREYSFVDMRYLMSPGSFAQVIGGTDPNFVLEARVNDTGALVAYRFLQRGKDTDKPWTELE